MEIIKFLKNNLNTIARFLFLSIAGTLLHFTYEWSGKNPFVAIFSSTNESTWEHLKLLFFPMLFLTAWDLVIKHIPPKTLLFPRTIGTCAGMLFIIIAFYLTWGITGKLVGFVNIALFFIGVIFALWAEAKIQKNVPPNNINIYLSVFILTLLTLAFAVFTFKTPGAGIFYNLIYHPKG